MPKKKAFVLRIDEAMLKQLEKWAADDFRSINGQIEWILSQALKKQKRSKPDIITEPDSLNQAPSENIC